MENAPGVSSAAACQAYMDHVLSLDVFDLLDVLMTFDISGGEQVPKSQGLAHSSMRHCQATAACQGETFRD